MNRVEGLWFRVQGSGDFRIEGVEVQAAIVDLFLRGFALSWRFMVSDESGYKSGKYT